MKITLDNNEITQSVQKYVESLISIPEGKKININFQTTRSPFSIYAEIDIVNEAEEQKEQAPFDEEPVNNENPSENTTVRSLFGNLN